MFPNDTRVSPKQIDQFAQYVEQCQLVETEQIQFYIEQIVQKVIKQSCWTASFQNSIQRLERVIMGRLPNLPSMSALFNSLQSSLNRLQKLNVVAKDSKEQASTKFAMKPQEKIYMKFMMDQNTSILNSNHHSMHLNSNGQNPSIGDINSNSQQFESGWQLLFQHKRQEDKERVFPDRRKSREEYQVNLDPKSYVSASCLGCAQFFYEGFNLMVEEVNQIDIIPMGSILNLSLEKELYDFKRNVSALANSFGGVIVFDCIQEYLQITAKGLSINEKKQQNLSKRIREYLESFKPTLYFGINAELRFVPVVKDPYLTANQSKKRDYIPGRYVTVLKIWPSQPQCVVFFGKSDEKCQLFEAYFRKKNMTVSLKGRDLVLWMKRKFKRQFVPQQSKEFLPYNTHCFSSHICLKPDRGIPIAEQTKIIKRAALENNYEKEKYYDYMSLAFLKNFSQKSLSQFLNKNFLKDFQFQEHMNMENGLTLLFHKPSLEKIIGVLNKSHQFKKIAIVLIKTSIQIKGILIQAQFKKLTEFLKEKNSEDSLIYYESEGLNYLQPRFKVSFVYLFFVLIQMNFKGSQISNKDYFKDKNAIKRLEWQINI